MCSCRGDGDSSIYTSAAYHKRLRDTERYHLAHSLLLPDAYRWQTKATPYGSLGFIKCRRHTHASWWLKTVEYIPSTPCLQPCDRLAVWNTVMPPPGNLAAPAKKASCFARRGLRLTKATGAKETRVRLYTSFLWRSCYYSQHYWTNAVYLSLA